MGSIPTRYSNPLFILFMNEEERLFIKILIVGIFIVLLTFVIKLNK